jgi:putative membrane protein
MKLHYDHEHYPKYCLGILALVWIICAIKPWDTFDWMLENVLTIIFVGLLIWSHKKFKLSNLSYTLITIFLILHTIGSHYTYAKMPLLDWLWPLIGATRNQYDRIVHFSFGLLLAYPIREVFLRIADVKGFWGYYLPFDVTASFSAIYEIIEFLTAAAVSPELGSAYLGSQGDEWDAQKDMLMAITGAFIAMCVTASVNWRIDRKFGKEMSDSFDVKGKKPLGEEKIESLLNGKN